jgi:hypothetical protein
MGRTSDRSLKKPIQMEENRKVGSSTEQQETNDWTLWKVWPTPKRKKTLPPVYNITGGRTLMTPTSFTAKKQTGLRWIGRHFSRDLLRREQWEGITSGGFEAMRESHKQTLCKEGTVILFGYSELS